MRVTHMPCVPAVMLLVFAMPGAQVPKDPQLQASLAAGAVAAAEAQMAETAADGRGRAVKIEARAKAAETMILARSDADADVLRAEGAKKAGELLSSNRCVW